MSNSSKPKTSNVHESTWDRHGSSKWTYFSDGIKQRINFFLVQKLFGRNIDVGGGWYLHYPNSAVVDLSSVCLANNPATEKLQFDLDELSDDNCLPYTENSFDSATLISTWQYLRNQHAVASELERILKPGAEIYIINGQGAGLQECVVGSGRSENIRKFFQEKGYDTLIENVPSFGKSVDEFQSVCVAMPDIDLFGRTLSRIRNKETRIRKNEEKCQDPLIFQNAFADWELRKRASLLSELSRFPITKYAQEYLERIERFSQECNNKTGGIPLIFLENTIEPELLMLTPEYRSLYETLFLMGEGKPVENKKRDIVENLFEKYDLSFAWHSNYFNFEDTGKLLDHCAKFKLEREDYWGRTCGNQTELRTFANFVSSISLNSFTGNLQKQMYEPLKSNVEDFDLRVERQRAFGYHMATFENKQQRRIDRLILAKRKINGNGIETVGESELNFGPYITLMRDFIIK